MQVAINFAPTGMVPTKAQTPHVPIGIEEIIEEVHEAYAIGITTVHLHARDETGAPSCDPEIHGRLIEGIRAFAPDLVICVSLSGRAVAELERRIAPLSLEGDLKPDMGSLTLGSLNFARQASLNAPDTVQALAKEMAHRGVLPELEVFDAGMINYAKYLTQKGLVEAPHYFNLLLGNIAGAQADLLHAALLVRDLPPGSIWCMAGIGEAQLTANAAAIAFGGGVRVGLEDNIWYDRARTRLARNAQLIQRVHRLAELHERPVMQPDEFREMLGLKGGHGAYGRREQRPTVSPSSCENP